MSVPDGPVRTGAEPAERFPGYDHAARECMLNLVRAHTLVRPLFERTFQRFGLNGGTFNVLMILRSAEEPLSPSVIGERVTVTRAAVTGMLDALERRELIDRVLNRADRRMFLITITPRGRHLLEELLPHIFELEHAVFSCLAPREQEEMIRILGKVEVRAQTLSAQAAPGSTGTENDRDGERVKAAEEGGEEERNAADENRRRIR